MSIRLIQPSRQLWAARVGLSVLTAAIGCMCFPSASYAETTSASGGVVLTSAAAGVYTVTNSSAISITAAGTYYLAHNVYITGNTNGIVISASNVTLDLNGHTITTLNPATPSATPSTTNTNVGVRVSGAISNVTIKNGTIVGFHNGVLIDSASASAFGNRVENVRVSQSTWCGMWIQSSDSLVRACQVYKTSGSTQDGYDNFCYGILFSAGASCRVIDCDVSEVSGSMAAYGIFFSNASNGVALNNRISQTATGVAFTTGTQGIYRDNLFNNVTTKLVGGNDGGGNF